jgi:propanol-preferring alcohol dehydrogenase
MADHLTVGANRLVAIGGLDPVAAAVLTDAGLTTYHSVTRVSLGPEPVAVVIGVGGLGHLAVQLLQECTPARVVAVDRRPEAADLARAAGADVAVSSLGDLPEVLRDMGHQADAVFDLVVTSETLGAAASILRPGGELVMVGGGGGVLELGRLGRLPFGARASTPFWGTMGELRQVLDLAARGSLDVHAVTYPLDEAARAFTDLAEGKVLGRAVLIP